MIGNLPSGEDFNFVSNGYPCALGVDTFNLDSGGEQWGFRLVKMKAKATAPSAFIKDWEHVASLDLDSKETRSVKDMMNLFLISANPALKLATGDSVPAMPARFLDQCKWLVRHGLAFNAETMEVVTK